MGGIIAGLRKNEVRPEKADFILSTAHKAKGAQWGSVKLSEEFQNVWDATSATDKHTQQEFYVMPDHEELALQYVAATRAETLLAHRGLIPKVQDRLRMIRNREPIQRQAIQVSRKQAS